LHGESRLWLEISRPCGGKGVDLSKFVHGTVGYEVGCCNHPLVLRESIHQSKQCAHLMIASNAGTFPLFLEANKFSKLLMKHLLHDGTSLFNLIE
jgi:hypothetical protein